MVRNSRLRRLLVFAFLAIAALTVPAGDAAAQPVNRDDILYILPFWGGYLNANDNAVREQIADLRRRVGPEGAYVKLGFSVYIFLSMQDWNVDISNPAAVRAAVAAGISQIDNAVAKARANGVPLSLSILTAIRERYDPVQTASEAEDIRSMQWYADNVLARGWWTHSRYARKQFAIQRAYMREIAKHVAGLMRQYPDTLVAASGDGEVELALARGTPATIYADYSPFMVAEFRDWLRLGGLYAPGTDFAGQGYSLGARYAGDATPGQDSNGDGHTLNGDFGTSFQTWNLLHFDWSLTDQFRSADPRAIPLATYSSPGYNAMPAQIPGGFDPPRTPRAMGTDAWWDLWVLFKQTMLQHHNQEFAKWMTTSPEPATGFTIPPARWYSYQIAGDYLFNGSPQTPNERWYSSMSSLSTADTSPYGSLGITAFNIDFVDAVPPFWAVTLAAAAPAIAARDVRWGLIEWHPGVLPNDMGVSSNLALFRAEMDLVAQYRPSLLQPFGWDIHNYEIKDTAFQTTLAELVARLKTGTPANPKMAIDAPGAGARVAQPFSIGGWAVDLGKIRGPGRGPGIDRVDVYAYPNPGSGQAPIPLGSAAYGAVRTDVAAMYGSQFGKSGFSLNVRGLPVGRYDLVASGRSTVTETFNVSATVSVTIDYGAAALSPATLKFGTTKAGDDGALVATTPAQVITASYNGPGIPVWSASSSAPWLQITSGPGAGQFTVAIVNPGNVIGGSTSLAAAVSITASNVGVGGSVPVALTIKQIGTSTAPFGAFDTPADGAAGLQGSFAVTGWALDDIGVDRVEIWRDPVAGETTPLYSGPGPGNGKIFIATPLFIAGSRTDVEALYPNYPFASRAGWGYLLLSWGLWNQGNATYALHAFAFDAEGNSTALGTKTISVANASATKPFGAIDTPEYGSTKSGSFWNYGWALTPNASPPCTITNGNVQMSIDSGPLVPVNYGDPRSDIAAAFPGFSNGDNAGGAYHIDTTQLSNGMHQIGWLVTDSCNRQDGIGSRFFSVLNAGPGDSAGGRPSVAAKTTSAADGRDAATSAPVAQFRAAVAERLDPIAVGQLDGEWQSVWPSSAGQRVVEVPQGERIEIRLPSAGDGRYTGFHAVNGERRALPLGSSLDASAGIFYWQPAAGFLGHFDLVFVAPGGRDRATDMPVRIIVGPAMRAKIDTPSANAVISPPFDVAGWAIDLAADNGSGVDTVHIWAYPLSGESPVWLGVAAHGDPRPDVGALFGPQFGGAAYGLSVSGLPAGVYDLVVYPHRARTDTFDGAQSVRVIVR